jgi:hypothetical protein
MPIEWYLMKQPTYNSGFEGDEFANYASDGFEEILESELADDIEIFEKSLNVEPVKTRAIIQGVTSDTYNNSVMRQFICRIGTLRAGQYIKARGQYWMVYSLPDNNKMYEKAIAWQCKYSIYFISPVTGKAVEYPVYDINSTQYGSGETTKTHMTIGTSQHLVYIPYNSETIMLDSGFRFLIDKNREEPTAYRLAQVDSGGYSCGADDGLLQWTIIESQYDKETDNKELMIADYYGKSIYSKPEDPEEGYSITLTTDSSGNKVTFGEDIRIDLHCFKDGVPIDSFEVNASLTDGNEYGEIKEVGDGYIIVRALNNRDYIGQEITLEASNDEYGVSASIILTIGRWY